MEFERPWLVQRCYLNDEGKMNFDYMGSSEFEFGTIPKALGQMAETELAVHKLGEVISGSGVEFFVYGSSDKEWNKYRPIVLQLQMDNLRTLEPTRFDREMEFLLHYREPSQYDSRTNIWFDLRNNCFFSISQEKINQLERLWKAAERGEGEWSSQPFGGYVLKKAEA